MKKKYILGIQCFATMDSGACIIQTSGESDKYEYVAISEERLIRKNIHTHFRYTQLNIVWNTLNKFIE